MWKRVRYFSVAVTDLDSAIRRYQDLFGLQVMRPAHQTRWGFRAVLLGNGQDFQVELIQPTDPSSALARFMRERAYPTNPHGEGVYMLGVEVDDLEGAVRRVEQAGGRVSRDPASPHQAWVHPTSAHFAFIELSQAGAD